MTSERNEPIARVSALFELDLARRQFKPLGLQGGGGGMVLLKDGSIYLANSDRRWGDVLAVLGKGPFYRLDVNKRSLKRMRDEFVLDSADVTQPKVAQASHEFMDITSLAAVKLVGFDERFYIVRLAD